MTFLSSPAAQRSHHRLALPAATPGAAAQRPSHTPAGGPARRWGKRLAPSLPPALPGDAEVAARSCGGPAAPLAGPLAPLFAPRGPRPRRLDHPASQAAAREAGAARPSPSRDRAAARTRRRASLLRVVAGSAFAVGRGTPPPRPGGRPGSRRLGAAWRGPSRYFENTILNIDRITICSVGNAFIRTSSLAFSLKVRVLNY